jgi:predicted DNA-binding protein with PD1-like motif
MRHKLIHESGGQRVFALILETGDEFTTSLVRFVKAHKFGTGQFTAIGAFRDVTLGYFNWGSKQYERHVIKEQVEVLSLLGDVALNDGEPSIHAHVVVGRSDCSTRGGHLLEGHVRPTLELILTQHPAHLTKQFDAQSGLALISV